LSRPALHWAIAADGSERGNALGYATANRQMRAALEQIADVTPEAPVAVHFCVPSLFKPLPGKKNLLFTMYESARVPDEWPEGFARADAVVVPSVFCRDIFRPHTDKPIYVCPLGVDLATYTYKKRQWPKPGETFRWLYVGAPNQRKWSLLEDLYRHLLRRMERTELYIKTTNARLQSIDMLAQAGTLDSFDGEVVKGDGGRFTVDNRFLSAIQMRDLYWSAHGFIFPTVGEGWGLTPLEAQATGLAPIVTGYSGHMDFCTTENSYPIRYRLEEHVWKSSIGEPDRQFLWAMPDITDAMRAVADVVLDWHGAQQKGKAAARSAQRFSWTAAAQRLLQIAADCATFSVSESEIPSEVAARLRRPPATVHRPRHRGSAVER